MFDIVIVGAGPSGASCALFTAKAKKQTLLIDNGNSITKRAWIENHYGVVEATGPQLVETGIRQATKFGAQLIEATVVNITPIEGGFQIVTDLETYESKYVVLGTGLSTDLALQIGLEVIPGIEPRVKSIIKVDSTGQTNQKGIYAAGAVAGTSLHTIITAGDGAKVAIQIISELNGIRYVDHDVLKA